MKILYVSSDFNRSGAALAMIELSEQIRSMGNEVLLLYPGMGEAVTEAKRRNLPYTIIRSYEWVKPLNRKESLKTRCKWALKHLYNMIAILRICHLIKMKKIDVVHNNTLWGYVGACAAEITGCPLIWHMRELLEQQQQQQLRWPRFGTKLINSADAFIAISKLVIDNYQERFQSRKMHLIYDGVDIDQMYRENHALFQTEVVRIIIAGSVRESKRQFDVVRTVGQLIKEGYKVHLEIVGDDTTDYAASIKAYVEKEHLQKVVSFIGEVSDVAAYMERNDISITASKFEAFGRVTAEAMLTGCVVVASDSGANEEIITDQETGYIYQLGNTESLANVIKRILKDQALAIQIAEKGKRSVVERFSSRKNAQEVSILYEKILSAR